jgi:aryl-alcohol dehydrogenase
MRLLPSSSFSLSSSFSTQVTACVAHDPESDFTLETLTLAEPNIDEVQVRVVAVGVCHTDIAVKQRNLCAFPMVLGHEGAGVVEKVGEAVKGVNVGDHVLMSYASCGSCSSCMEGQPGYCHEHGSMNFAGTRADGSTTHTSADGNVVYGSFFQQSSFSTHVLADKSNVVVVPKHLPLETLAPLGCGIQTGAGAVINTFKCGIGDSVVVYGCGGVGLSAIMAAKASGCSPIIAVDVNPSRLALAVELGASHTIVVDIDNSEQDVAQEIKDVTPGKTGAHYAIETSGRPDSLRSAYDACRPLASIGLIGGAAPGVEVKIDMLSLLSGKKLRGVVQGDAISKLFVPEMIDMWERGQFPFDKLITYYEGLGSLNEAVKDTTAPDSSVVKPVIRVSSQHLEGVE